MYSIYGGVNYTAGPDAGYTFFNLSAGNYALRFKSVGGCKSSIANKEILMVGFENKMVKGIERNSLVNSIKMAAYPNPSKGQFTVQVNHMHALKATVSITTTSGLVLQQHYIILNFGDVININLGNVSAGTYYVRVVSDKGTSTSKVVIQR